MSTPRARRQIGAFGMFPTDQNRCDDHEGSGAVQRSAVGRQEVGRDHAELGGGRQGLERQMLEESSLAICQGKEHYAGGCMQE